ncbi:SDR family oxidoreductase [Thermomonas carbonis]|uniref:SDR family oxidoreductase n=1 Tax=Thermomonas carbonis TaxID=1463158 RepID=A0A7G9SSJ2_9GAMM|nr:SDR family oxidoreductase [Thermomonas carbonis]QNN70817.1 SDR family oxidoreductase [Thermomonas carbonis]GHC02630.1 short-chain dehydrogenase [Thermomonas carbonis]
MARTALVTGANRGIGLEFVRQLLARGDHVVAACRHPGKASALNTLAGDYPGRLHVLPLDVADAKSRASLLHDLPLVLGDDGRIDLLLNNAGVLHSGERFGHVEQAVLDDSLRINAIGPFLLAQALAPLLRDVTDAAGGAVNSLPDTRSVDRTPGHADDTKLPSTVIANISSQLGSITNTTRFGTPSYAISKAAQNMASALLAQALAERGIVVLALHPGWVQTEMGGAQAQVTPAHAVAGLLRVIDAATPAQSGSFLDWRGESLPW